VGERSYDEAHDQDGSPRPDYAELLGAIDPERAAAELTRRVRERGISFGAAPDGYFALDPLPRVLGAAEWERIAAGIEQRMRALEAFTEDAYGYGRAFQAGVISRELVEASPHWEPAMRGARPRRWLSIAGLDVVRLPGGDFAVIEDQLRMPSGLAYAVVARELMRGLLPVEAPDAEIALAFGELAVALQDAAPGGVTDPVMVTLCEGPSAAAWWEHERLARELCAPLVTLDDLEHRDGRLVAWLEGRPRAVDVVYHRTDEARFSAPDGRPTALGEALLDPCSRGVVACVNAPGSGIADDKLVHAYVDDFVRFYLGEEPLLPSVRSHRLGDEAERARALERLDELVLKPRGEMGGEGVLLWQEAGEAERARTLAAIEADPAGFVAQERVSLSTHPTVIDGKLEPRHVDLRPYAVAGESGVRVLRGGLTRVALEKGSLMVNSGQGGGAKDTWITNRVP
jgi:carboxylate-amine ligase